MSSFERNGFRTIGFGLHKSSIKELKGHWKKYVRAIPPYPDSFAGKGIVICGGGLRYFTCCWVTIRMLRNNGCDLPIELWYLGNELSEEIRTAIEAYNVTCKNLLDHGPTSLTGCMLKPLSILKSSFREILFIDADNVCIGNPGRLFVTEEYKQYGAIFWPDFWQTPPENPIWAITGTRYQPGKEQESGQLLVNKERCWKELHLCLHFNNLNNIYHRLLMGDKDTFRFAWMTLKTPFFMIPAEPAVCGYTDMQYGFLGTTMIQHDLKGEYFFLHRNLLKWDVTRQEERVWTSIKQFVPDAREKHYLFGSCSNGHHYMDLQGDVEELSFSDLLPHYEDSCMTYLEELRASDLYHRFVTYSYFAANRYAKGIPFTLNH